MSKFESTMVVPKFDRYGGSQITSKAAHDMADHANGDRAVRSILEHDPHFLPVGKVAGVVVEELEDRFIFRSIVDDTHQVRRFYHQPTLQQMVEMTYTNDSRPFVRESFGMPSGTIDARADPINFDAPEVYESFVTEAIDPEELADHAGLMTRRSLTPEPVIQFFINYPELAAVFSWMLWRGQKFLTYTVDETLRKSGDHISDVLSQRIRRVIDKFDRHRTVDSRMATSHIVFSGNPDIHLLTRNSNIEEQTDISLGTLCRQMEVHADLLDLAESVTFARDDKNEDWHLLYIETSMGTVIASNQSYQATSEAYIALQRSIPVCLCLAHKITREERHYKTSAILTSLGEDGRYTMEFRQPPQDMSQWALMNVVLEIGDQSHPVE